LDQGSKIHCLATGCWSLATGRWLLVSGFWPIAIFAAEIPLNCLNEII
jgi:hypothetical protein